MVLESVYDFIKEVINYTTVYSLHSFIYVHIYITDN